MYEVAKQIIHCDICQCFKQVLAGITLLLLSVSSAVFASEDYVAPLQVEKSILLGNSMDNYLSAMVLYEPDQSKYFIGESDGDAFSMDWEGENLEVPVSGKFIMKLDHEDNLALINQFEGTGQYRPVAVETDLQGNLYILGQIYGAVDLDPGPGVVERNSGSFTNICLVKWSAAGEYLWDMMLYGQYHDFPGALTVTKDNNVCITGEFNDGVDFNPGPEVLALHSQARRTNVFAATYSQDGDFLWAGSLECSNRYTSAEAVVTDSQGAIYMAGHFINSIDVDPGPDVQQLHRQSDVDIYVIKWNAQGALEWAFSLPTRVRYHTLSKGLALAVDTNDNLVIYGEVASGADLDPGPGGYGNHNGGGLLMQLDKDMNLNWAHVIERASHESNSIQVDQWGNIYAHGFFDNYVDFDPTSDALRYEAGALRENGYLAKWDQDGQFQWASLNHFINNITLDGLGDLYVSGSFEYRYILPPAPCPKSAWGFGE